MILKILFLLIASIIVQAQNNGSLPSQYSLINCSWPCPTQSDVCVVTTVGANCQTTSSNIWVIKTPRKEPEYTGDPVSVDSSPCIPAPIPIFPTAVRDTPVQIGQSVIKWPVLSSSRPLDEYLGNCGRNLYCSSADNDKANPVCRQRRIVGSSCVSSNQCSKSSCQQGTCQYKMDKSHGNNDRIFAPLFGTIGALAVVIGGAFMYHRYRQHRKGKIEKSSENNATTAHEIISNEALPPPYVLNNSERLASNFMHGDFRSSVTMDHVQAPFCQIQPHQDSRDFYSGEYNSNQKPPSYKA